MILLGLLLEDKEKEEGRKRGRKREKSERAQRVDFPFFLSFNVSFCSFGRGTLPTIIVIVKKVKLVAVAENIKEQPKRIQKSEI